MKRSTVVNATDKRSELQVAVIGAGVWGRNLDVQNHTIVTGNPAKRIGWACSCGGKLSGVRVCSKCGKKYKLRGKGLVGYV